MIPYTPYPPIGSGLEGQNGHAQNGHARNDQGQNGHDGAHGAPGTRIAQGRSSQNGHHPGHTERAQPGGASHEGTSQPWTRFVHAVPGVVRGAVREGLRRIGRAAEAGAAHLGASTVAAVPGVARTLRGLPRRIGWEPFAVVPVLAAGTYLRVVNLFSYPRYQMDEGTYVSSAWAVAHGALSPYTYTYGHPPAGWTFMALWFQLTGGFFDFGTAINSGRVFMVWLALFSAVLVYLIARRLAGSPWVALVALAVFSFSSLAVDYQRQVLLDNVATFWVLVALYFLIASESRLRYLLWSGLALGIAVLSKETVVVLVPIFFYGAWLQASRFQRRFALVVYGFAVLALGSSFVLLAALKGELLPQGLLPGDVSPHVSLLDSFVYQAGRGSSQGAFSQQWAVWWQGDAFFLIAGMIALAGNLLLSVRRPWLRIVPLLSLVYWLFLARGGVTLAYYILPLIPLQALNIALFCQSVASTLARLIERGARLRLVSARWLAPAALLVLLALLIPGELQANHTNLTADESGPQVAALQWIGTHVPRSATVVVNHYAWLDLHASGGLAAGSGVPFDHVQMYWEVATDPAIRDAVLHDDWNNIDYVVADSDLMSDARNFQMQIILQAIQHAVPVQTFQNKLYYVTIFQVQHQGAQAPSDAASAALAASLGPSLAATSTAGGPSPAATASSLPARGAVPARWQGAGRRPRRPSPA
jgi:4-amino-4-deoxy-L-arabinose transferase-like glycosyltransferase